MRKLFAVITAVMFALVPVAASAHHIHGQSDVSYEQSQQQQTIAGQAQGHFGSGVQVQNQRGGNIQEQASGNSASTVFTYANTQGVNAQGQGYSQTNTQASFGSGPQFQTQGSGQAQEQWQSSSGSAHSHFRIR